MLDGDDIEAKTSTVHWTDIVEVKNPSSLYGGGSSLRGDS